jgi:hypothetical protein
VQNIANHVGQRGGRGVAVERAATNTNASLEGIIWLQSISASQFGEADKRPGVLQEAVCLTFAVVPVGANRTACQAKRGPVIRRFTSGTLEFCVTLRDSG